MPEKIKVKKEKILEVNPKKNQVIVEGVNLSKLHKKKTDKSEGGIIEGFTTHSPVKCNFNLS